MEVRIDKPIIGEIEVGSIVVLGDGRIRYIVEDEGDYFFVNLKEGQQTTCKYFSIEELLEGHEVVKHIPANQLVVSVK